MDYDRLRGETDPPAVIIAEAGINHDGDLDKALKMVDEAARAGADYVKFQSFKAEKLVTPDALTSSYIKEGSHKGESFADLLRRLEIDREAHTALAGRCRERGIKFLSTAFDRESFDMLVEMGVDVVKVASGDLTNIPLLRHMASPGLPMIISTGMATLGEIEDAVEAVSVKEGNGRIVLLHCVSWYPAEVETSCIRFMDTLRHAFGFPVGYSDHTLGINMSIAARALGAVVLEKHFTLDSTAFGPDHAASVEPDELAALVKGVREAEAGLGGSVRRFGEKELGQRMVHRRSIVVKKPVKAGEVLTGDNLTIKRPGTGVPPKFWYDMLGRAAARDLEPETLISWSDVKAV